MISNLYLDKQSLQGYRCKSDIVILHGGAHLKSAYSPFKNNLKQFIFNYLDANVNGVLKDIVPELDLSNIGIFYIVLKIELSFLKQAFTLQIFNISFRSNRHRACF